MSTRKSLAAVRLDISNAKKRLQQLWNVEAGIINQLVACRGCGAKAGYACSKPSGGRVRPHGERVRDADKKLQAE